MLAAVIALALAVAILVVAAQASSLWSSRTTVPPAHPAPQFLPVGATNVAIGHLPRGCRPKLGCDAGSTGKP
jgi:uncharacterized iron-regulated membrane protein